MGQEDRVTVLAAVEDQEAALGAVGALFGQDDAGPELTRADDRRPTAGEGAAGRGGLDLGDPADVQAARLQQGVAIDVDRQALELVGDAAVDGLDVAGDEDRDRGGAGAGQLVGHHLAEQGDPEVALLDHGGGAEGGGDDGGERGEEHDEQERAAPGGAREGSAQKRAIGMGATSLWNHDPPRPPTGQWQIGAQLLV